METNTSSNPSWEIEFNNRIQAFADAIGVSVVETKKALADLGIDGASEKSLTIIDSEEFLPMNDLFEAFVDSKLTKKALLRAGMPHLRGKTHLGDTSDTLNGNSSSSIAQAIKEIAEANKPITSLSDSALLDRYNETETEVAKILRERTHGRRCIVFNKNGDVNKDVSLELIKIARKQTTPDKYSVQGKVVRTYRVGEFQSKPLDESPFFPGVALVNGYCHQSDTIWDGICHENQVLLRIYVTKVEPRCSQMEMKSLWKQAKSLSFESLRSELGSAALLYDEMQESDTLPKLKVGTMVQSNPIDNGFCN